MKVLDYNYFIPKSNAPFERQIAQASDEMVDQFVWAATAGGEL